MVVVKSVRPSQSRATPLLRYGLTRRDVERIVALVPGVNRVVPVREVRRTARCADRQTTIRLVGTTWSFAAISDIEVTSGRFLSRKDVETLNNVAVLGRQAALELFRGQNPLGGCIRVDRDYYLVVGVAQAGGDRVFIPITTMRSRRGEMEIRLEGESSRFEHIELSEARIVIDDRSRLFAALRRISSLLDSLHDESDYSIETGSSP